MEGAIESLALFGQAAWLQTDYDKMAQRVKMDTFHDFVTNQLLLKAGILVLSDVAKEEDMAKAIASKVSPQWCVLDKLFQGSDGVMFFSKLVRDRVRASYVLVKLVAASPAEKPRHSGPRKEMRDAGSSQLVAPPPAAATPSVAVAAGAWRDAS